MCKTSVSCPSMCMLHRDSGVPVQRSVGTVFIMQPSKKGALILKNPNCEQLPDHYSMARWKDVLTSQALTLTMPGTCSISTPGYRRRACFHVIPIMRRIVYIRVPLSWETTTSTLGYISYSNTFSLVVMLRVFIGCAGERSSCQVFRSTAEQPHVLQTTDGI